jgi:16S rRNA (guanine527-N7)-methyltransferase
MYHIIKYFPDLTPAQKNKLENLGELYSYWNQKINIISRKDIKSLYLHHILHSLSIARVIHFNPMTKIADVGTGGGFPGIPLSILFPEAQFYFIDSRGKKIKVVEAIIAALGLKNCQVKKSRAEDIGGKYDFIIGRAVMNLPQFVKIISDKVSSRSFNSLHNGILYLKGGAVKEELKSLQYKTEIFDIYDFFKEPYFKTKIIVYIEI